MRKAVVIQQDQQQIDTVEDLTGVFESISSTQVARTKDKVALSKEFFQLLWRLYTALRVDPGSRITERKDDGSKRCFVIIAAQAGLSGDIDTRLIETMLETYDAATTDIVVVGAHGAQQLEQRGVPFVRYFQVPENSVGYIDVSPVIDAISAYSKVTLYYEEYISLGVQGIKSLDLVSRIQEMSQEVDNADADDFITSQDTIFEPSLDDIADLIERTMITLAFSQAILESSLAQNASRFNAMAIAKKRAFDLLQYYKLEYHRAKRYEGDRRTREVIVSIKKKRRAKDRSHA